MKRIERYVIKEAIGGGVGTVYRAEEQWPGDVIREVAIKVLPVIPPGDKIAQQRFFDEVKVLAQLAVDRHVVTVYGIGLTDNTPWIAMEYCRKTLAQTIGDHPEPAAEVLKLIEQMARGLATMHALEPPLIHQDLKPANILVDKHGNYKITDFSMATLIAANKTQNALTVRYAAPELLSREFGAVCPATDLYALGHIAYEMALGARQHRAQFPTVYEGGSNKEAHPMKWMQWHCSISTVAPQVITIRKDFPPALNDLIAKLMAKPFKDRFATSSEVMEAIEQAKADLKPVTAAPPPSQAKLIQMPGAAVHAGPTLPIPVRPPVHAPPAPSLTDRPIASESAVRDGGLRYWVRFRGKTSGPFDLTTMQRQVRQGAISRLHQVSTDQANWQPASVVEGLFGTSTV